MTAFIVAEAGVNHMGSRTKMLLLCQAAKDAGADAVKFQAYDATRLMEHRNQRVFEPGIGRHEEERRAETYNLLKTAQLSDDDLEAINDFCKSIGMKWFASVFDPSQIARVLKFGACALKIGHAEREWVELRDVCVASKAPVYASSKDWEYPAHMGTSGAQVAWVKCTAEYPAVSAPCLKELEEHNYTGFSSHYADWRVPAATGLLGAQYLEAHIKLSDDDYEAKWSLSVEDFGKMVKQVREYESWL